MLDRDTYKKLRQTISSYEKSDSGRSIWQLVNTFVPFFALWGAAYWSLSISYWLTLLFAIVAGGMLIRVFIIFHDCCHGSFLKSSKANAIVGNIAGILTLCPYQQWRRSHAIHHSTSGNLDKHGVGDIWTLTVQEYLALPRMKRLAYRLYRNPFILFGIGPAYTFLIDYRFNRKEAKMKERLNTYFVNLAIVGIVAFLCWLISWQAFLLIQVPIFLISGTLGIWLFYIQHNFEGTYYEKGENWNYIDASLQGSSYYRLPRILHWFTGNIGFHHIHHLSPRIPNYNLTRVHRQSPVFEQVPTVTLFSSLKSLTFRLWDEESKRMVSFRHLKKIKQAG